MGEQNRIRKGFEVEQTVLGGERIPNERLPNHIRPNIPRFDRNEQNRTEGDAQNGEAHPQSAEQRPSQCRAAATEVRPIRVFAFVKVVLDAVGCDLKVVDVGDDIAARQRRARCR